MGIRVKIISIDTRIAYPDFLTDAWHIHKSLMLIFLCAAVLLYHYYPLWKTDIWFVDLVIMGIAWDVTFNTFYNHLLKRKR
jgi:hypothetical protein